MTFEEWLKKYTKEHNEDLEGEDLKLAIDAWEAGYTAATHNALENVKRMTAKLFGKE